MKAAKTDFCELCEREVELTFHHLIPKKMHNKRPIKRRYEPDFLHEYGIWVCGDCHKMIHRTFDHKELAFIYNSKEKLIEHEGMAKFLDWVKKQDKKVKR